ncbi:TetR/AcrR family transcriptional regulator [Peterkaempfera bronchialis]|uniref:TetR/AcrR family transcriptional regulator n=1 Tax=Peterkaempfera bronchialis TaxID=2126346 RepID=A0A345SYV7_9ACTN|nr:TetR/AcrR family transcriptional regulator [Peterkaempfera bronchialis]AXI78912.1 TetR/AcrR family transcriptional regulator [Peterkaempfera bronchialis]
MSIHAPRGDTRARILDVALELFSEQGYEKTSLREIADRLGVTKAALYYHFKTKDDIVRGIVESMSAPIDEVIAWAQDRPWSPEMRDEVVRRFAASMSESVPLVRFFHENQPAVRELNAGALFKQRMIAMVRLIEGPESTFQDRVRAAMSIFAINAGLFLLQEDPGEPNCPDAAERQAAALEVALEIADHIRTGCPSG